MRAVPWIGTYFANRLARADMPGGATRTPGELGRRVNAWLSAMPVGTRRNGLRRAVGSICQNRRASSCRGGYYVRDVNPGCFMGILSLLSILWGEPSVFHGAHMAVRNQDIDDIGANTVAWRRFKTADGTYPAAECGCITTQAGCASKAASCAWVPAVPGRCVPRWGGLQGFEGIAGYMGEKGTVPPTAARRPLTRYVRVPGSKTAWRVPGALRRVSALPATAWP